MGKYVLAYQGGAMAETEAAQQAAMEQWMNWFGSLGEAVVDGGNPFGPSLTVASDGSTAQGGKASLTGYSIISAGSLDEAATKAKGCPVLSGGGTIDVYETIDM